MTVEVSLWVEWTLEEWMCYMSCPGFFLGRDAICLPRCFGRQMCSSLWPLIDSTIFFEVCEMCKWLQRSCRHDDCKLSLAAPRVL